MFILETTAGRDHTLTFNPDTGIIGLYVGKFDSDSHSIFSTHRIGTFDITGIGDARDLVAFAQNVEKQVARKNEKQDAITRAYKSERIRDARDAMANRLADSGFAIEDYLASVMFAVQIMGKDDAGVPTWVTKFTTEDYTTADSRYRIGVDARRSDGPSIRLLAQHGEEGVEADVLGLCEGN